MFCCIKLSLFLHLSRDGRPSQRLADGIAEKLPPVRFLRVYASELDGNYDMNVRIALALCFFAACSPVQAGTIVGGSALLIPTSLGQLEAWLGEGGADADQHLYQAVRPYLGELPCGGRWQGPDVFGDARHG